MLTTFLPCDTLYLSTKYDIYSKHIGVRAGIYSLKGLINVNVYISHQILKAEM